MTRASGQDAALIGHLRELRKRVIIAGLSIFGAAILAYIFVDPILDFLTKAIQNESGSVFFFSPQGAFFVKIQTAFFVGFLMASPIVFSQGWAFAGPGLYPKERSVLIPIVIFTTVLFLLGVAFAYFLVLPLAIHFLINFGNTFLRPLISVSEYLGFVVSLTLAFGLAFNLPVVILVLVKLRLVKIEQLKQFRPFAVLIIFVVGAILTPPDVISQCLLAGPLVLLYELSIILGGFFGTGRKKGKK